MTVHEIGESKIGQTLQNGRASAGMLLEPDEQGRPCDQPEDQGTTTETSRSVELDSLRAVAALSAGIFDVATMSRPNRSPASADSRPRRFLAHRSLASVGTISYGIVLWHAPLLSAISARGGANLLPGVPFLALLFPTFAISTACGWVSHRLIERPAMRLASAQKASAAV